MKFKLIATVIVVVFLIVMTVIFGGRNPDPNTDESTPDSNVSIPNQ